MVKICHLCVGITILAVWRSRGQVPYAPQFLFLHFPFFEFIFYSRLSGVVHDIEGKMLRKNKKIRFLFCLVLVVGLLINLYFNFSVNSRFYTAKRVLIDKDKTPVYLVTGIDKFLAEQATSGNVVLKFRGFSFKRESDRDLPFLFYSRSVYSLYPRRIYAVPDGTVVNNGRDIKTSSGFVFSKDWLNKHSISTIIELRKNSNGSIGYTVSHIPQPPESKVNK